MTEDEKNIIKMYFVNEALRLHMEVLDCKSLYDTKGTVRACMKLLGAVSAKESFDKVYHDLCALLSI